MPWNMASIWRSEAFIYISEGTKEKTRSKLSWLTWSGLVFVHHGFRLSSVTTVISICQQSPDTGGDSDSPLLTSVSVLVHLNCLQGFVNKGDAWRVSLRKPWARQGLIQQPGLRVNEQHDDFSIQWQSTAQERGPERSWFTFGCLQSAFNSHLQNPTNWW